MTVGLLGRANTHGRMEFSSGGLQIMLTIRRRIILATATAIIAFLGPLSLTSSPLAAESLPSQLSDEAFWNMVNEFSEPGGYFRSDNFVSNETTFQYVLKDLKKTKAGGVYLGVGPDQNFTYIVATQPKMAIIFDIRRQNMLQHLMYKALLEMSSDRADFVSRLFSRKRPAGLSTNSNVKALFDAYEPVATDPSLYDETLRGLIDRLVAEHKFQLSEADKAGVARMLDTFRI